MKKTELLIRRGFAESEIEDHFAEIPDERWLINTVSKEEINRADPDDEAEMRMLYEKLFAKDSVDLSMTSPVFGLSFSEYLNALSDAGRYEIEASVLEPHIARLIHALNRIGVMTVCSCDGWHEKNKDALSMKIWMPERYSVIWMWLITEYVFGENWNRQKADHASAWWGKWEPEDEPEMFLWARKEPRMVCMFDEKDARKIHEKNNRYAGFLEEHAEEFNRIHNKWIGKLQQNHSSEVIDSFGFLELRKLICGYIRSDLEVLMEEGKYVSIS